jgi:hypothetical protein
MRTGTGGRRGRALAIVVARGLFEHGGGVGT